MYFNKFVDNGESFQGYTCYKCGEIVDAVIMKNRILGEKLYRKKKKRRWAAFWKAWEECKKI